MPNERLGFVGSGAMGDPMAGRLLDAGYTLTVHDTRDDAVASLVARGALTADTPAEVARNSDIVLVCLPTPDIVREVRWDRRACGQRPHRGPQRIISICRPPAPSWRSRWPRRSPWA
jgi:3-hydroxyisobutyrate dehydrogenase-like beta-hydroxyacid dehydrogenase